MYKPVLILGACLLLGTGCLSTSMVASDVETVPTAPAPGKHVAFEYGQGITLGMNDTASFADGLRVQLTTINDSRCQPDVVCIWAGELGATLTLQVGDGPSQELILGATTKPSDTALGYTFKLVDINESGVTISVQPL